MDVMMCVSCEELPWGWEMKLSVSDDLYWLIHSFKPWWTRLMLSLLLVQDCGLCHVCICFLLMIFYHYGSCLCWLPGIWGYGCSVVPLLLQTAGVHGEFFTDEWQIFLSPHPLTEYEGYKLRLCMVNIVLWKTWREFYYLKAQIRCLRNQHYVAFLF